MKLSWETRARVQFEGDAHVIEDACGFNGATAWIIDGATTLLEPLGMPAASDPQWLAQFLSMEFARLRYGWGTQAQIAAALRAVDEQASVLVGGEHVRFPSAALSVATLNADGVEVASLADCTVVVRTDDGATHLVRAELADARVDAAADGNRAELLKRDRELRNTPGRLWVARREPEAADHAHVVQLGHPEQMVMATDGAWRAVDLGIVAGPEEFLERTGSTVGTLELMSELRRKQAEISEVADDATVMTLVPRR
ncbi:hypothetical protein AOC05_03240 [Arthrobacter alpinus]|uniref:Protein phosphatase 2C n=1 Tax=Arthrobacter alpinus TaxID=656366 RepID=A0A0M4QL91_9MICC|nr:hypothetical protein [Arthrobacter alpinus]ALE91584.1 hypothetical protein AOC05_03240 [Arthrobacter alpinus]